MKPFQFKKDKTKKTALTPEQKKQRAKKLRRVSVSGAGLALALVAVILLNLVCSSLTERYDLSLDLTANKMYAVSDESVEMLEALEQDVTVTILASEDKFRSDSSYSYVYKFMNHYLKYTNGRVTVKYIDPNTNPNAASKYADLSSNVTAGSVIFQCGDNSRVLNQADFFDTESDSTYGYTYATAFAGEQAFTSAILAVTSEDIPSVYLVQGHNESVSESFCSMLEGSGYAVEELTLAQTDIPNDAAILVVSLPQVDFTEAELNKLDAFVKNGGDVMVFDGTAVPTDLTNLNAYLKEWGIVVNADMVIDADYHIYQQQTYIFSQLADSAYNNALGGKSDQVLITPDAKSLTVGLADSVSDRTVEALLESKTTSYAKKLTEDTDNDSYDKKDGDTDGPFALAALAQYTANDKGGSVFVCSSAFMMTDNLMQKSSVLNKRFLGNVAAVMRPDVEMVTISSKSLAAEPLTIGAAAQFGVFVVLCLIPLLLFVGAVLVFLRRRHL